MKCDELKVYVQPVKKSMMGNTIVGTAYYLKSEADKVIEEKDKEIADLIEKNKRLARKDLIMASNAIKDVYKELRHHKYKRCLDKVKWCEERIARYTLQQEIQGISWQKEIKFYRKLQNKFIEISKQFKEVKNENILKEVEKVY